MHNVRRSGLPRAYALDDVGIVGLLTTVIVCPSTPLASSVLRVVDTASTKLQLAIKARSTWSSRDPLAVFSLGFHRRLTTLFECVKHEKLEGRRTTWIT